MARPMPTRTSRTFSWATNLKGRTNRYKVNKQSSAQKAMKYPLACGWLAFSDHQASFQKYQPQPAPIANQISEVHCHWKSKAPLALRPTQASEQKTRPKATAVEPATMLLKVRSPLVDWSGLFFNGNVLKQWTVNEQ